MLKKFDFSYLELSSEKKWIMILGIGKETRRNGSIYKHEKNAYEEKRAIKRSSKSFKKVSTTSIFNQLFSDFDLASSHFL